ncbi:MULTISPECIES: DUF4255 domain-containing protein [Chryseobacterium]|jgi:hypothetical protein|uniref:DUF4255 domain-containing protein n=1 Tax=Chryseobacterium TaxID=59732 RepID=UPI0021E5BF3E|nr:MULTISPECIES: DUF4255 domain-containing protein [Chryseobacterium]MEA1848074.1 DUF4255 domain-containing protein [Chryseobacterium sp. MHB01]MEC5174002.1 hypothetical protein [Chryseobacterium nepalense]
MIKEVLTILKNKLNDPVNGLKDGQNSGDIAIVDDIAKHEDDTSGLDDKVVITLLNVEEESTLKNRSWYTRTTVSEDPLLYDMKKQNPPAYLNLYLMVAANRNAYDKSLSDISKVIEIFQTNNVLEYTDSNVNKNFRFRIELHSIPFEQLSYIWGLLGGKVMPSALYKVSVVKIEAIGETNVNLIDEVNIKSIKVE